MPSSRYLFFVLLSFRADLSESNGIIYDLRLKHQQMPGIWVRLRSAGVAECQSAALVATLKSSSFCHTNCNSFGQIFLSAPLPLSPHFLLSLGDAFSHFSSLLAGVMCTNCCLLMSEISNCNSCIQIASTNLPDKPEPQQQRP